MTIGPSSAAYTAASSQRSSFPERMKKPFSSISIAMFASRVIAAVAQHCSAGNKNRQ